MLASGTADLLLDERLHAEADAVNSGIHPGASAIERDVAGRGFERGFRPGASGDQVENARERGGIEVRWGAPTQVYGLGSPPPLVRSDFTGQCVQVKRFQV